ncbi:MAG: polysaccharide deacetylase family protein [Planctomycetota bacterium]
MRPHAYLTFHGIGAPHRGVEGAELAYWIDAGFYRAILDLVKDRRDVSITFDDGNRSDVDIALPELRARGLSAEFFVCAGRLASDEYLSPEDIRTLLREGMSVGSHGWSHVRWRGLSKTEQAREWPEAIRALSAHTTAPVTTAACPFGEYDRTVIAGLRGAGVRRIYTSDCAWTHEAATFVPRFTVTREHRVDDIRAMLERPRLLGRLRDSTRILAKQLRPPVRPDR